MARAVNQRELQVVVGSIGQMCGDGGYKGGEAEVERDAPLLALRILVESGGRDDAARFWVFGFRVFGVGFSSRGTSLIPLLSQPPNHEQKKQNKLFSPLVLRHQSVGLSCGSNRTVFPKSFPLLTYSEPWPSWSFPSRRAP